MTSSDTLSLDFRSDTVTQPDETMRRAMASAEVGDNVLDGDPTVKALEERAASVLGMPAALWTPTGTMANVIALSVHLQRGDRFLAPKGAHVLHNELGSAAWLAGGMPDPVEHDAGPGRPSPEALAAAIGPRNGPYFAMRTTLLCLENTHNGAGGAVIPPHEHAQLLSTARQAGLRVHLDGARIWHAATALGLPPAALTVGVDTVSACFSKGLGAPVGSVVAGSANFVERARRMRQMLGGGVRQGGVLAAAALVALDRVGDLAEDHEKARRLSVGLAELGWEVNTPETNIVLARVADVEVTLESLKAQGILAWSIGGKVRFVTHRDLSMADVEEALRRIKAGGHP
ncbi:threonine aldolase [Amycolatopsis bartoniae]|uniref:Threonine aldolase n=2 Tax=Amycolatopsis bartoniae TaxID=941986 RepID=A0A8H9M5G0_9PSEU|nr:GntG family PLP-dependent aldolase [Amycolatopsis bartoniae]MBB2933049.1 threonine aldolase [Amycolatopsis bartoniae]TVT11937.1 aminotransferase class I/II-fold pyridoxal phosphate-dependent enzyme [Amycolatopsis bartoniae]GHF56669.1 threonine aldolase [Amycolatopsis bartoniae]